MKKLLLLLLLLMTKLSLSAQDIPLTPEGTYEVKKVITVDGTSAATLYDRAILALSDWTGASGKASAGLDIHDREAGLVVYKGHEYMWTKKQKRISYDVFADFTLKVRCKDGKAQITSTIHSMTAANKVFNLREAIQISSKGNDNEDRKKEIKDRVDKVKSIADVLLEAMSSRLIVDNDDF